MTKGMTKEEKISELSERMRGLSAVIRVYLKKGIDVKEYVLRKEYLQECKAKLMNGHKVARYPIYKGDEACKPWYLRPVFE